VKTLRDLLQRLKWRALRLKRKEEACEVLIQALYRSAFGRSADPAGLNHYLPRLKAGIPLETVARELAGSEEFQTRLGPGRLVDTKFLNDLYRNALGRPPDAAGLQWWLGEGEKGIERFQVLAALASSDQVLKRFGTLDVDPSGEFETILAALYRAAFGRPAEKNNLEKGITELRAGSSLVVLADDLVRSIEFQERHGCDEDLDLSFITDLYLDGLGRRPDLQSLAYWLSAGKKGATRADLLAAIARSDEATGWQTAGLMDNRTRYQRWISGNDAITTLDRSAILKHLSSLTNQPLISVVVPAIDTTGDLLRLSINSLLAQLYPHWELRIGLREASEPELRRVVEDIKLQEPRIPLELSVVQKGTIEATQRALAMATGEFVTFLMPGDLLPEQALYEVAVLLNGSPAPDIVYTDSDQIDSHGERFNPRFKPGFDPDLLLSHNYVGNLVVYRQTLLQRLGELRPEFNEAADHDLILRAAARTTADRIAHIPAVLYHERKEFETLDGQLPVPSSSDDHRGAVIRDFLDRQGHSMASLVPVSTVPGAFQIVWPLSDGEPLVSIIVPTRDRAELVSRCVEGILQRTDYSNFEILIVDNESRQQLSFDLFDILVKKDQRIRILSRPGPFNYSALNNAAAGESRGEVLLLLNNDTDVISEGWLRELVSHAIRPDVGVVGAKLLYENETVQHGGVLLGPRGAAMHIHRFAKREDPGYCGQLALTRTLSAVTGACLAIRRKIYLDVGGLDEVNLPVSYNDFDLCLRVQARGYRVVWTPFAELIHLESVSRGSDESDPAKYQRATSELRYFRNKWKMKTETEDQFHNPNLQFSWSTLELPSPSRRERPWTSVYLQDLRQFLP
jgi:GT2 family glycosyltransferase